jgi:hypothetical protein
MKERTVGAAVACSLKASISRAVFSCQFPVLSLGLRSFLAQELTDYFFYVVVLAVDCVV